MGQMRKMYRLHGSLEKTQKPTKYRILSPKNRTASQLYRFRSYSSSVKDKSGVRGVKSG